MFLEDFKDDKMEVMTALAECGPSSSFFANGCETQDPNIKDALEVAERLHVFARKPHNSFHGNEMNCLPVVRAQVQGTSRIVFAHLSQLADHIAKAGETLNATSLKTMMMVDRHGPRNA